jgi:hypothetical protein
MAKPHTDRRFEEKPMPLAREPALPVSMASATAVFRRELETAMRHDPAIAERYPALSAFLGTQVSAREP